MKIAELTGSGNYFEDFKVGDVVRHARGKTMEPLENVLITNLVLNTAQGHFNEHVMQATKFGRRIAFGGVNFSLVIGLTYQDTGENALQEVSLDNLSLKTPVCHGDTLYAFSEVLVAEDADRPDAGLVTFRHYGVNQRDEIVFEGERKVLLKRRSHWADR
jgi:acyl dehydratase